MNEEDITALQVAGKLAGKTEAQVNKNIALKVRKNKVEKMVNDIIKDLQCQIELKTKDGCLGYRSKNYDIDERLDIYNTKLCYDDIRDVAKYFQDKGYKIETKHYSFNDKMCYMFDIMWS